MASRVKIEIGGDTSDAEASIKDLEQAWKMSFGKMATEAEKSSEDVSKAFKSAGIRTEKAIRESSAKAKRDFEKIKRSGVSSANDIKRAHNAMTAKIKKNNLELSTSSTGIRKIFDRIKISIIAAGVAAVGFFGLKALSEAIRFETALIELQKVLNDTEGDAKQFTAQVEELSKTFGESGAEVLQGVAIFKQAGFEISEAFLLQESAMSLAASSALEVAEAAELMKRSLKGFKAPATEVVRLTDVLNEISNLYGTNLKELAIGMAEISPIAKKMGFSFEETVGLLTPIIEVFGSGTEAAQALKTGLIKLIDDALPVTDALRSMGIEQKEFTKGMESGNKVLRSGRDIYFDVAKRFETLDRNQKLAITSQLTSLRQTGKLSEVFDGLALTIEITNKALEAEGSIAKETAIFLSSTAKKGDRASASFSIMAKSIGDFLLPVWNALLDIAIPTMDAITRGIRGMSKAIKTIPDIASFLVNPFSALNRIFGNTKDVIKDVNKETQKLNETTKQQEESIKKVTVALIDTNQIRKEEEVLIKKNRDVAVAAFEATGKLQKAQNESLREAIRETRNQLRELESEAERAAKFSQRILDEIAKSQKRIAQAEFDPLEILVDDLERAEDDFKKAAKERAAGNIDLARELTLSAVRAANAILEVKTDAEAESEITSRELVKATREAESLVKHAKNFAIEMEAAAKEAIPLVKEELKSLEDQLQAGKDTLAGIKSSISEAKKLAVELKTKLSEDTTATHTQIINTINTGGGNDIPGFKTGVHIPGYGGGDTILAKLEKGEDVIKKESVRSLKRLGPAAMNAIHSGDIKALVNSLHLPGFKDGRQSEGTPSGTTNVNLLMGDKSFPMTARVSVADEFVTEIKSINVIRSRKKHIF